MLWPLCSGSSQSLEYRLSRLLYSSSALWSSFPVVQDSVYGRRDGHSKCALTSCCQVARSCFKGVLRAHRHFLFSFTIQMLVQSDLLKYWFAETARYQNGQGSTASSPSSTSSTLTERSNCGDVFLSIPRRASQDLSALEQQCGLRLIRLYARVSPCSMHTVRSNSVVWRWSGTMLKALSRVMSAVSEL